MHLNFSIIVVLVGKMVVTTVLTTEMTNVANIISSYHKIIFCTFV